MPCPTFLPGLDLSLADTPALQPGQVICLILERPPASSAAAVEIALMTRLQNGSSFDQGQTDYPLLNLTISPTLQNDNHRLQLPLALPAETPVSHVGTACTPAHSSSPLWLQAKWGDRCARLPLQLDAPPPMRSIFDVLSACGLQLSGSHMERGTISTAYGSSTLGCYQVFEFANSADASLTQPSAVSLSFICRSHSTIIRLEIIAASGGGYSSVLMDENWQEVDWGAVIRSLLHV